MNAAKLYRQLAPFAEMTDKKALAVNYRALALAPDHVRATAPFGEMRVLADLGLPREVFIEADGFLQQLRALPEAELTMELTADRLRWTCGERGSSRGSLTLLTNEAIEIPVPKYTDPLPEEPVGPDFGPGLELGALACGSQAMRTFGLDGVQIRNQGDKAYAYATDNSVMSACCLGAALDFTEMLKPVSETDPRPPKDTITMKLEAAGLLAGMVKRDRPAFVACNKSSLYAITEGGSEMLLHQVTPLRTDIATIVANFSGTAVKVPLLREAVSSFLRRAEALAETHQRALVNISVENGQTRLVFDEQGGSTEEHYIVPEGPRIDIPPVRLAAHRLAVALAHAEDLIFDYAKQSVLVLRGPKDFLFAITGRAEG